MLLVFSLTMPEGVTFGVLLLRLALSALFGAAVGWERESLDKPAGLRTHMLVGLGAACFTLIGLAVFHDNSAGDDTNLDPIRVVEGVAGGIGFLGAGAILKGNHDARGLTTAAGIWTVGGVGSACGAGYFEIAGAVAAVALIILLVGRFPKLRD